MQEASKVFWVWEKLIGSIALRIGRLFKGESIKAAGEKGLRHGVCNVCGNALGGAVGERKQRCSGLIRAEQVLGTMRFARRKRDFGFAFGGNHRLIDEIITVAYGQIVEHEPCYTKIAHRACLIPNGVCGVDNIHTARAECGADAGAPINPNACGFIDADGKPCGI